MLVFLFLTRIRYVPYPFHNNLCVLDVEDQITCLNGLVDAALAGGQPVAKKPNNFEEWMLAVMGIKYFLFFSLILV